VPQSQAEYTGAEPSAANQRRGPRLDQRRPSRPRAGTRRTAASPVGTSPPRHPPARNLRAPGGRPPIPAKDLRPIPRGLSAPEPARARGSRLGALPLIRHDAWSRAFWVGSWRASSSPLLCPRGDDSSGTAGRGRGFRPHRGADQRDSPMSAADARALASFASRASRRQRPGRSRMSAVAWCWTSMATS